MRSLTRSQKIAVLIGVAVAGIGLSASSCEGEPNAASRDDSIRQSGVDALQKNQPAHTMSYSPTRETKNFWIDTWNQPGKLSYVYLMNGNGDLTGYYVLKGLPVSYCVGLVPPVKMDSDSNGKALIPQASVDGTYSSGNDCNTKYGQDATTGAYVEFTVGTSQNVLLYDQPLSRPDVQPLGPTTIEQAQKLPQPPTGDGK